MRGQFQLTSWNWTSWYTHDLFFAGTSGEVKSEIKTDNSQCSINGTVTLYRKVALGYIEILQKYLNNEFKPYIDRLDEIRNIYIDEYKAIEKSVKRGAK